MIFANPTFTTLLSKTEFDIEHINVGHFCKDFSHLNTVDKEVFLDRTPILFNDRVKYTLLNDTDETLVKSIKSLKSNCKILSIKVIKTDLNSSELIDTFKLLNLKNQSHRQLENNIKDLIISGNYALNYLCKLRQKQLGYINKNLLTQKLSSQTLARINKEIDLELCRKKIIEKELFEINEINLIETLKKLKNINRKIFLSEIIENSADLEIDCINDIALIFNYIIKNNLTKPIHISLMKELFCNLKNEFKSPPSAKFLFKLISEVEKKKKEKMENYNFLIDSWGNRKERHTIMNYFIEKMGILNER